MTMSSRVLLVASGGKLRGFFTHPLVAIAALVVTPDAVAQEEASSSSPLQVREFLRLLEDPAVQEWLKSQGAQAAPPATAAGATPQPTPSHYLAERIAAVQQYLHDLRAGAVPGLPLQVERAGRTLSTEVAGAGQGCIALLLGLFIGLGLE